MDRSDKDTFDSINEHYDINGEMMKLPDLNGNTAVSGMQAKSEFSRIGFGFAAFLAMSQLLSITFMVLVMFYMPVLQFNAWTVIVANVIILYGLSLPVSYFIVRNISTADLPSRRTKQMTPFSFIGLLCCSYAGAYLSNIVTLALITAMSSALGESFSNPLTDIMSEFTLPLLFYVVVLGPVMEEVLFRKILLDRLRKYGDLFSIVVSALMFSLFHLNLFQMVYAFVLGCVFAYVTLTYGKLRYSCFLHIIINGFGYFASMLTTLEQRFMTAFSLMLLVVVISGIVVFLRYRKTIRLQTGLMPAESRQFSLFFQSPGIWVFLLIAAVLTVAALFGFL